MWKQLLTWFAGTETIDRHFEDLGRRIDQKMTEQQAVTEQALVDIEGAQFAHRQVKSLARKDEDHDGTGPR